MDPLFLYRDGVDVPRDVTRVIVHPSVRVLPPEAFRWCENLEEVQLHEGLEEIGDMAFWYCVSLRRLNCPSTVVRIGDLAFYFCRKLEEVQLNEGLEEIGDHAFWDCRSLRRLNCPSTVVQIGDRAFGGCRKLKEVQLNEGLKGIGGNAFFECFSLRRLSCPSTVVWLGGRAFGHCRSLSVVELVGILKVEGDAFAGCCSLDRIQIRIQGPSRAFVVQRGNYRLVTDGTIAPTRDEFALIAPGCLTALPESSLMELGNSIGAILINGEGTEEDQLDRVCQEVRGEVRGEISAILGLAFWKAKIDEAQQALISATQEVREGCQREVEGKGKLIAQNVLPFLDGLFRNGSQGGP